MEITERFVKFLAGKFGSPVVVEDAATDVLRQPMFPGLDAKAQLLGAGPMEFPEYMSGMHMLPGEDDGLL